MTLTTYSNRGTKEFKETYFWSLKKSRGMMALLALLMFLAFPLILMIGMVNAQNNTDISYTAEMWITTYMQYVTALTSFLVTPLILLFALIITVQLFSYLHQKRSIDLFHSLPVGRTPMLLGRLCAGLTAIFVPLLVNYAIASIIGASYGIDAAYSFGAVASSMLWLMLMSTAAMIFSIFMAVCTGTIFDMVVSILGINVAYPLLIFAICTVASYLLPGMSIDLNSRSTVLTAFAPFAAAFLPFVNRMNYSGANTFALEKVGSGFLIWWIVLTLVMLAGSLFLYKKRKSECAENSFAFSLPKIFIRFIITAVAGLGMGLLFHTSLFSASSFFIGVAAGSLAAHIVVEAVYSRGFRQMKRSFTWYGIFAVAFIIFYGVLATGFFGYDTRLPAADDVESISVSIPNQFYNSNGRIYDMDYHRSIATITPVLKDRKNIDQALKLHQEFLSANRSTAYPYCMERSRVSPLTIEYHLKNGSVMKRNYSEAFAANKPQKIRTSFDALSKGIGKMEEYIQTSDVLFYLEPEYIKSIDINNERNTITIAPDEAQKAELLEALKQDYMNGEINNPNIERNKLGNNIYIECKEDITPTGRLKELLGNYSGKVHVGSSSYDLPDDGSKTSTVMNKYNWNK